MFSVLHVEKVHGLSINLYKSGIVFIEGTK